MNQNGTGGTFHTDNGRIAFKSLNGNADGCIRSGTSGNFGGVTIECSQTHELNYQNGDLKIGGPIVDTSGRLLFGNNFVINREYYDIPHKVLATDGTFKFNEMAVYADNTAALAAGLPEHTLYTTPTGELRVVRD